MRKVVVSEFLTLDGVMQAPGGEDEDTEGGFPHGGWQMPYFDEIGGNAIMKGFAETDAFLLGRKTYDIFAAYWPNATTGEGAEFAGTMNAMRKHVASRTLDTLEWENSTLLEGDAADAVRALKETEGKTITVIGSGDLVQTLIRHNLVDEYNLMIHPVVLGTGKRLFRDDTATTKLELVESTPTTTGVLFCTYRPAA